MADLRELATGLGLTDVRSLLQSGNLVFGSEGRTGAQLEILLEGAAAKRLDLATDFFVRTATEWKAIIAGNPFVEEAASDPGHLVVFLFKKAPKEADVKAMQKEIKGREVVRAKGRHAYAVYPDGIGESKLTNAWMERRVGTSCTGRNWNTVLKLGASD